MKNMNIPSMDKFKEALKLKEEDAIDKKENNMCDYISKAVEDVEKFNERAWDKGRGYEFLNFKEISDKLEGLEEGMYLIAGESNSGKSALMLNLMHDICENEANNLLGVYYSLDDASGVIYSRVIAMNQSIPISVCSKPSRYQESIEDDINYEEYLEKREVGLQQLKDNSRFFLIKDRENKFGKPISNSSDLVDDIEHMYVYAKSLNKDLIVAIDSINDIALDREIYSRDKDADEEIPVIIKSTSTRLHIPIFCSTHLRKLNAIRRPIIDDLRNANTLVYEASMIWIVYNDVSKNKQAAKVYWTDPSSDLGKPIIELDWAKNKISSYKGRDFFMFEPNYSKAILAPKDSYKRYESLIYDI